uniref:Uncharacterized protein n=1 Tax=Glossina palpalis gambiensis TaxID=67801 RepID=A0A1B0BYR1_9MUSC
MSVNLNLVWSKPQPRLVIQTASGFYIEILMTSAKHVFPLIFPGWLSQLCNFVDAPVNLFVEIVAICILLFNYL